MKWVLVLAALGEAVTGVALLLMPSLVGQLLLGAELTGTAVTVARVAGIALIALSVACWPGTPLLGMLGYIAALTLYLAYLGLSGAIERRAAVAGGRAARGTDGNPDSCLHQRQGIEDITQSPHITQP